MTRMRVLVIEDNLMNMELATDILTANGHEVLQAATAPEALALLEETKPDLILMDIQLPGVSGLDLTKRLKADPGTSRIPIVAITSYAMKGDEERALEAGCDGYIPKPIDFEQFYHVVGNVLKRIP